MRLSLVCFFKKSVPGNIFGGKHRLVRRVTKYAMQQQVLEYERQEKIMHLLRYPYLTAEESSGHVTHVDKKGKKVAGFNEAKRISTFKPHVTIEERLNHLRISEGWPTK